MGSEQSVAPGIRPVRDDDVDALVQLTLAAFVPVFRSFEQMLGPRGAGRTDHLRRGPQGSDRRGAVPGCRPAYQNRGVGTALNLFALERMRESGVKLARVETGNDSSHASVRRTYEKAGYVPMPLVRYFKSL